MNISRKLTGNTMVESSRRPAGLGKERLTGGANRSGERSGKPKTEGGAMNRLTEWTLGLALMAGTLVLAGCGGPTAQIKPEQLAGQVSGMKGSSGSGEQNRLLMQAQAKQISSQKDYQVGPEDLLNVQFFGNDNMNREIRVNGQGEISLPLVGDVKVAGKSPLDIEKQLVKLYGSNYLKNPSITVNVKEFRHQRVAITGAVAKPGTYEMIGPKTLLEMLATAGGLQDQGTEKPGDFVQVTRNRSAAGIRKTAGNPVDGQAPETLIIDLHQLLKKGDMALNVPIRNGDIINIPFAGNAFVLGAVRRPGTVPVKGKLTVSQAIASSGGLDTILSTNKVTIVRYGPDGQPETFQVNMKRVIAQQEPDILLKDQDVVFAGEGQIRKALLIFREMVPGAATMGSRAIGAM